MTQQQQLNTRNFDPRCCRVFSKINSSLLTFWLIFGLSLLYIKLLYGTIYHSESWSRYLIRDERTIPSIFGRSNTLNNLQERVPYEVLCYCLLGLAYIPIFIHGIYRGSDGFHLALMHMFHFCVVYSLMAVGILYTVKKQTTSIFSAFIAIWILSYYVWGLYQWHSIVCPHKCMKDKNSNNKKDLRRSDEKAKKTTKKPRKIADKDVEKRDAGV